jgi:hypothetical protein
MKKKPHNSAESEPSASQLWRERLNKNQAAAQGADTNRTPGKTGAQLRNRFANPASGATARKSRKGLRPG